MMRCPTCGRQYEAATSFCPDDGTALVADTPAPASAALDDLLAQADAPAASVPAHDAPAASGRWLPVLVGVLGVGLVALLGLVVYQQQASVARLEASVAAANANAARRVADRPPADAELAYAPAVDPAPATATYTRTVWANSPGDGFLALRSAPSVAQGQRLLQIPHGDPLDLGACLPRTTVAGASGSWCRARYGGTEGWAFDAFVTS